MEGSKNKFELAEVVKKFGKQLIEQDNLSPQQIKALYNIIQCREASMAGAEHVIRYLGQYTHRVAISNHRILNITNTHVTFIAKDYRDRAAKKPVTLDGVEFLRRFCMHVFPKRFVRIRRYGIYNPALVPKQIRFLRFLTLSI